MSQHANVSARVAKPPGLSWSLQELKINLSMNIRSCDETSRNRSYKKLATLVPAAQGWQLFHKKLQPPGVIAEAGGKGTQPWPTPPRTQTSSNVPGWESGAARHVTARGAHGALHAVTAAEPALPPAGRLRGGPRSLGWRRGERSPLSSPRRQAAGLGEGPDLTRPEREGAQRPGGGSRSSLPGQLPAAREPSPSPRLRASPGQR
ncbi:unnamed protein product [Lepidochelys kempii]